MEVLAMPKVTQKGQVTIPHHIRAALGIETGDQVTFELDRGKVVLKKKAAPIENIKKYIGFLSYLSGKRTDDIIDELRGRADDYSH
jgi:AbrB family looped-hinge helix DNA binding protein